MNHSTSADAYVPSALSFVAMDGASSTDNQKHHQLWDWDYNSQPTTNTIAAAAAAANNNPNNPYLVTAAGSYMDCQSSLLPVTNFPFYTPMVPDYHHQPIGLIKVEEEGGDMAAAGQIGLNLGHRTYFPSGDSLAIDRLFRRSRAMYQLTQQVPRCQAEGCKADLSGAKHYHRRHKVCEFHSKATVVVAGGLQQRFCQQCSRFHVLSEFDEAKRSCRRRLADHNRRRRKPQPTPSNPTPDPAAPNNSEENKHITHDEQNAGQICTAAGGTGTTFTTTTTVGTFSSTSSMSTDSQKDHNQGNSSKVALLSGGPALSLGADDGGRGGGGGDFGFHHSPSYRRYHHHHHNGRPFSVMSDEESPQYQHHNHHMPSSSSSATFYHSHHHDFFCSNTSIGASQSTPGNGSTSEQANHQSNQLPHLGQGLFEVDFM